jgi:hypothetical protein
VRDLPRSTANNAKLNEIRLRANGQMRSIVGPVSVRRLDIVRERALRLDPDGFLGR